MKTQKKKEDIMVIEFLRNWMEDNYYVLSKVVRRIS